MAKTKLFDTVVRDVKAQGFDFRINDLDESLEIKISGQEWARMNDTAESIIKTDMREIGYGRKKKPSLSAMKDAYTKLAHQQRYNPIRDYFDSLPSDQYKPYRDGPNVVPNVIPSMSAYVDNPDGQFGVWLFKWMVGAIAKIYEGARNPMLVLVGPQRTGKSWFTQWLCPVEDRFLKSGISPDSKDSNLRLADVLIWEVEELGATTRRADVEALKAFVTKPFIYERPPYGRHPIHKPANASFIGTVNYDGAGFLTDVTGSTRFLSCEIESLDFAYSGDVNVDQLWLEAVWFYRNVPQSWELTEDEKERQAQVNAKFETVSALADVIESYFEITNEEGDFMTTQQIKQLCSDFYRIHNENAFNNELARVLYKLQLSKGRQSYAEGGRRGWHGIKPRILEDA